MKDIEINGRRIKIASTVDSVGLFCPMPVVKLKLEIEKADLNNVIELLADDPGVLEDVPAWCRETGNELIAMKKNTDGVFVTYVKKAVADV